MAYTFGAVNTDRIDCGTTLAKSSTFSVFVRFKLTASDTSTRMLATYQGTAQSVFYVFASGVLGANTISFGISTGSATAFPGIHWLSGFSAGVIHTVVVTYDGTGTFHIYADTDATQKTSFGSTGSGNGTPDTSADQRFYIGNQLGQTISAAGTIYEVGYWPGTVLTGAEAAAIGSGTPPAVNPTNYWGLINDADAMIGGVNGTVTGASNVAHSGTNLYGAARQGLAVSSNRVRNNALNNPNDIEGLTGVTIPDTQWAAATISTLGAGSSVGVGCRWASATTYSGYMAVATQGSPNTLVLKKYTAGVPSTLGTSAVAPTGGDQILIEAIGSGITTYLNNSPVITVTDATYASGTLALKVRNNTSVANGELDDFLGGDFANQTVTTLDVVALPWTGGLLAINATTMLALGAVALTWTGTTLTILESITQNIAMVPFNIFWTGQSLNVRETTPLNAVSLPFIGQALTISGVPFIPGQVVISQATVGGLPPGQYVISVLVADAQNHQLVATDPLPAVIMSSSGTQAVVNFATTYEAKRRVVLW